MRKFIIERELPAIGSAERQALREAAQKSNATLKELGPDIQWVQSYVAADKTFCVYLANDEAIIHEHARRSGFPANKITEVRRMIDPTTATESKGSSSSRPGGEDGRHRPGRDGILGLGMSWPALPEIRENFCFRAEIGLILSIIT